MCLIQVSLSARQGPSIAILYDSAESRDIIQRVKEEPYVCLHDLNKAATRAAICMLMGGRLNELRLVYTDANHYFLIVNTCTPMTLSKCVNTPVTSTRPALGNIFIGWTRGISPEPTHLYTNNTILTRHAHEMMNCYTLCLDTSWVITYVISSILFNAY